jgi:2'-5' RNA ligase
MPSAVIVRARLPATLDRLRRASVTDAAAGVPAHATLLYPFVEPAALTPAVRRALADVARRHRAFGYTLRRLAAWSDTLYVAVAPAEPFVRLQRELQRAFPAYPIYGRMDDFEFVPHITIAEGAAAAAVAALRGSPAGRALPPASRAERIEVIATDSAGRWHVVWRIPLAAPGPTPAADRMRP